MRGLELGVAPLSPAGRAPQGASFASPERPPGDDGHHRTAVDKAFELLAAIPGGGATAGVTELARDLALSKSTVFRLLGAMERNGIVEREGNRYRLGRRVYDIGARVYEAQPGRLLELLMPTMTGLYEESHETVSLAVLRGGEVLLLGRVHGSRPMPPMLWPGSRFPAHCSALGKALLAHSPDVADELLARGLSARTPMTIDRADDLRQELQRIRERGIAINREEGRAHLSCVAVALLDEADHPLAALAIGAPSSGFNAAHFERLLRRAAVGAQRVLRRDPLAGGNGIPVAPVPSPRLDNEGRRP